MTVGIDDTAVINNIIMTDQSSAPATPGAGKTRIFTEANGLYVIDDEGLTIGPLTPADGWIPSKLTWTWNSSDDPSYVIETNSNVTGTFSAGMRFKITDTSAKMFIVTKVAFSGSNTQLTMYGGTDYDLTSGTLTAPYYSSIKAPLAFPLDPTKWTVTTSDTSERIQTTPTQNVWYNIGPVSISIPIGIWFVDYQLMVQVADTATLIIMYTTLSTANNSESDTGFTAVTSQTTASAAVVTANTLSRSKVLALASKTAYYLNQRTTTTTADYIDIRGDVIPTLIRAICAYL